MRKSGQITNSSMGNTLIRDSNEGFGHGDIIAEENYWFVDYHAEGAKDLHELGLLLARCQSTSTYCRLYEEDYDLRARRSAKLISASDYHIRLAFPAQNISNNLAGLLLASHVGTNKNLYDKLIIRDIIPPASYAQSVNTPRGISNFKPFFSGQRPVLIAVCKPSMGLDSATYAKRVEDAFSGGADIVKDDENILPGDPDAPISERIKLIANIMVKFKGNKQKRMFIFNVHGADRVEELCAKIEQTAVEKGVHFGILISPLMGLPLVQSIRNRTRLPVFSHSAGISLFTSGSACFSLTAYTKLLRLAGADAIIIPPPNSPYYDFTEEDVLQIWNASHSKINNVPEMFVAIGGGLEARDYQSIHTLLGDTFFGFLVGGAIFGDPNGPKHGAKKLTQQLTDASSRLN